MRLNFAHRLRLPSSLLARIGFVRILFRRVVSWGFRFTGLGFLGLIGVFRFIVIRCWFCFSIMRFFGSITPPMWVFFSDLSFIWLGLRHFAHKQQNASWLRLRNWLLRPHRTRLCAWELSSIARFACFWTQIRTVFVRNHLRVLAVSSSIISFQH